MIFESGLLRRHFPKNITRVLNSIHSFFPAMASAQGSFFTAGANPSETSEIPAALSHSARVVSSGSNPPSTPSTSRKQEMQSIRTPHDNDQDSLCVGICLRIVVWQVGLRGNIDGAGCNDKKNDENRKERKHDDDADSIRFEDSYECRMPNAECRMPMMRLLVPVTVQRGADFKISLGLPVLSN